MGNLEKAGVLVVVALLAVILVVAFLNFPDQNAKAPPVLGASVGKLAQNEARLVPQPMNVPPAPPQIDVIRPKVDEDRSANDPAPKVTLEPDNGKLTPPIVQPKDIDHAPPPVVKTPERPVEKSPPATASGYPKTVKVQPGESLWAIAVREYGPKAGPRMLGLIADANPKVRPEALKAGTEISLPAPAAELSESRQKGDAEKKPAPPPGTSVKAPPAPPKTTRKLPFIP
jgi:LysM repeat protein